MAFPTTITIQPLSEEEIPTFITIELDAFRTHPRIPMLWPRGYTPDLYSYYNSTKIRAFHDPASRFFKAVDGCGKMLAGLQMTISLEPPSTPQDDAPQETKPVNWPEGGNWHMYTFFQQNRRVLVAETFGGQAHTMINYLVVSPAHQSRGIGKKLLRHACQIADSLQMPIGLESTPVGFGLYQRHGFEERRTIKADMRSFGIHGDYDEDAARRIWMVRPWHQQATLENQV